jgi:asparagine synthase (glutamine-hydrolysing)
VEAESEIIVHPDLAQRAGLFSEAEPFSAFPKTDREAHSRTFADEDDATTLVLEEVDHLGRLSGVEHRHPFYDKRLIECSVGLPGTLKLRDGWPRYVLRAALAESLPESIRWRSDKADLSYNFQHNLLRFGGRRMQDLLNSSLFTPYVDRALLETAINRSDTVAIWHALALAQWLHLPPEKMPVESAGDRRAGSQPVQSHVNQTHF